MTAHGGGSLWAMLALTAAAACAQPASDAAPDDEVPHEAAQDAAIPQDSTSRVAQVAGLSGPEAVRYDPDQDVWFVANFGDASDEDRDGNGFISRVAADGTVETLRFMTGAGDAPLHMPRGMALRGDSLFVADIDGVHAFDRHTGAHLRFIDMTAHEPGFINDLAFDGAGVLYATDTGRGRVYRLTGDSALVAVEDERTGPPNGITWDAQRNVFLLAPWNGEQRLRSWDPATGEFAEIATLEGGNFDGIEIIGAGVLLASQADSTLYVLEGTVPRAVVRVPGRPADIGVDMQRGRVAVPYIALDRVDVWQLR